MQIWSKDVRFVKGVGEKVAKKLYTHLNIRSVHDLLFYPPYSYSNRQIQLIKDIKVDESVCIRAAVQSYKYIPRAKKIEAVVKDSSGVVNVVWFGRRYVLYTIKKGIEFTISGKTKIYNGKFQIVAEDYSQVDSGTNSLNFGRIVPVYSLPDKMGAFQKRFRTIISNALEEISNDCTETLPLWLTKKYSLTDVTKAVNHLHFPSCAEDIAISRRRLAFEEAFCLFLALEISRMTVQKTKVGFKIFVTAEMLKYVLSKIPFKLTESQDRIINEILSELNGKYPMYRLLQGDVGSGKTVIAFFILVFCSMNNLQGAIVVPTEILAEQHFKTFRAMFPDVKACLLNSSVKSAERKKILKQIQLGEIKVIIGTHSLIQKDVVFNNLAAVIIDEQHKFGVLQREEMVNKGYNPHVLVMTATPIPRSLALTLFGDAQISVLDQLPPNRKMPITKLYRKAGWLESLPLIKSELDKGHQAYFVYPLITESEKIQASSATEMFDELKRLLPEYKIELVHGRLKKEDREKIMDEFRHNKINIIVSTVVIEIGVDVPNATVMVVDNAERFGLSQLHQLRGRIVRSDKTPYCILIAKDSTEDAKRRIDVMLETCDGFKIAEEDLQIRGPGQFIGHEQKGYTNFMFLNLMENLETLLKVKEEAKDFIKRDPKLISNWGIVFRDRLKLLYKDRIELGMIV